MCLFTLSVLLPWLLGDRAGYISFVKIPKKNKKVTNRASVWVKTKKNKTKKNPIFYVFSQYEFPLIALVTKTTMTTNKHTHTCGYIYAFLGFVHHRARHLI